jgi:hypothetical protein
MLRRRGEAVPASRELESAVLVRPDHVPTYDNLGKAYFLAPAGRRRLRSATARLREERG